MIVEGMLDPAVIGTFFMEMERRKELDVEEGRCE